MLAFALLIIGCIYIFVLVTLWVAFWRMKADDYKYDADPDDSGYGPGSGSGSY